MAHPDVFFPCLGPNKVTTQQGETPSRICRIWLSCQHHSGPQSVNDGCFLTKKNEVCLMKGVQNICSDMIYVVNVNK